MTSYHYNTIIIGAGQSDTSTGSVPHLTLSFGHPSPVGEGNATLE